MKYKLKNKKGFSLLEMIIAMFIFIMMITASVAAFVSVFKARKTARDIQKNTEEVRTAVETMAKNIRMSNKLSGTATAITMFNTSQQRCIVYQFSGGALKTGSSVPADLNDPVCLGVTATQNIINIGIVNGKFYVTQTDTTSGSEEIGKATIMINIGSGSSQQRIQTTLSFRDYDGVLY